MALPMAQPPQGYRYVLPAVPMGPRARTLLALNRESEALQASEASDQALY